MRKTNLRSVCILLGVFMIIAITPITTYADETLQKNKLEIKTDRLETTDSEQENGSGNDVTLFNVDDSKRRKKLVKKERKEFKIQKKELFVGKVKKPKELTSKVLFKTASESIIQTSDAAAAKSASQQNSSLGETRESMTLLASGAGMMSLLFGGVLSYVTIKKE